MLAVKRLRTDRGITFEGLAAGARLSLEALRRLESGETARPTAWTVRKLAAALGVPARVVRHGEYRWAEPTAFASLAEACASIGSRR